MSTHPCGGCELVGGSPAIKEKGVGGIAPPSTASTAMLLSSPLSEVRDERGREV